MEISRWVQTTGYDTRLGNQPRRGVGTDVGSFAQPLPGLH